jgi:NAD(P)-dependent dehydrogenase (short-subunit alcohol dehydrogenase family)
MTPRPEDDPGLDGRVAIVTGGGAADDGIGNGRAAAMLLARAGTKVLVVDRALALAERTVAMIAAEGGTAAAHEPDVTDDAAGRDIVAAALDRFGRLDFLDNNVGIGSRATVVDELPETWRRVMQVNVETIFLASRTGWDIGHAVRFLLSDHARYIAGHTLVVDGGVTLQAPARDSAAH